MPCLPHPLCKVFDRIAEEVLGEVTLNGGEVGVKRAGWGAGAEAEKER